MGDMNDEASGQLVERVRTLLAMAEGTPNSNEADAFSRKAAQLIAAHRIDPVRLRAEVADDLDVAEHDIGRGAYVRGRLALLQAIAESSGCHVVFQVREHGTVALVAGFRSDLRAIELLYTSLHAQASARMAAVRKGTPAATQRWRRSFLFGFANEIRTMLADTSKEARREHHPATSTVPALRARDRQVAEFARRRFGRVRAARSPKGATHSGFVAGADAARRSDVGRSRVGGFRAIGRGA